MTVTLTKRSHAKNVELTFGPMSVIGDLHTFRKSPEPLTSICPRCAENGEAVRVEQFYVCNKHDGMFKQGMLAKAIKEGDDLVIIGSKDDVARAKEEDVGDKKAATLRPYLSSEIEGHSYPLGSSGGLAYLFVATTRSALTGLLLSLCGHDGRIDVGDDEPPRVLVTELKLRNDWKLMRLQTWRGHLVLQELVRPQDLTVPEPATFDVDESYLDLVQNLIVADTQEFNEADFLDSGREKFAEFVASRVGEAPAAREDPATLDLAAALMASIDAAKKAKQPVRKTPAKRVARARKAS